MSTGTALLLPFLFFLSQAPAQPAKAPAETLLTVAEKSDFRATSRHADVIDFCDRLAKGSTVVRLGELGTSQEGRKLPLIILSDPPVATREEALRSNKLIVYAQGNIHAGEVDGKEAILMLARELATSSDRRLLKDLVIVFAPIFNADGNERMSKTNRPGQKGPEEGMGQRANAQGLDLNRDFIKLESPELRALVRFVDQWNPAIVIDAHTTNGSHHRYTVTYDGPRHAASYSKLVEMVRDKMLPDVGRRILNAGGWKSFFYGNFVKDHTQWEMYPPEPRYGIQYIALRNRIAILSESYSYASYRDRILVSRDFIRACLDYAADNKDAIRRLLSEARDATTRAGTRPQAEERVAIRQKMVPTPGTTTVLGYEEERKDGRRVATEKPKDYSLQFLGRVEADLSVRRPFAYLFSPRYAKVVENLQRHGIELEELREDIELDVEAYKITKIDRTSYAFQKHRLVSVEAASRTERRRVEAGTILVKTGQPLGNLIVCLLEPQSEDGLCTWNFFDDGLAESKDFPVLRLPAAPLATTGRVRPLPENRVKDRRITFDQVYGSGPPLSLEGSPITGGGFGRRFSGGLTWLEDGEHFLQVRAGRLYKVNALSGRSQPFHDTEKMVQALSALPTMSKETARSFARQTSFDMNPDRSGALFEYENDLYFCRFNGTKAVRLTKSPAREEHYSFSPNGEFVAFVRDHNLYIVDLATQTERALTQDGTGIISNGKADWVYMEEIFGRNSRAYWWSPDSTRIAFLRFDDQPVYRFTVLNHIPTRQEVESTPYPKAGDPNPLVKFGLVSVAGGPVKWADLSNYSETASLIIRGGWTPDSDRAFCYVQDRAQTWLDFCTVSRSGDEPKRLFRETTKAWVDDPGSPTFLKDGSFILPSERTGWKHLYHFDSSGKLKTALTAGEWEVRGLDRVDEATGWIYFTATKDNPIGGDAYRIKLDGTGLQRLTPTQGTHRVNVSPNGKYFIDSRTNFTTPTQVYLHWTDGSLARTLDTNPVYAIEEYRLGKYELVKIPTPDGFVLEGSVLLPPDFDAGRRYPVWFQTYGGPHAPVVHDSWSGGRIQAQLLATLGFVVFHADPRSASGKGIGSTWTAYRRLGIEELKDIEVAIRWLCTRPYIDPARIGMSGHSYGGFMTAFALTHSKLFAAGIAGAPVTDWRNYDSIYTERYMNTPQENPEGYDATSVVKAARNLHGRLFIAHGIMDDNVHMQNSIQLVEALQRANKDFEIMIYPRSRHGIIGRFHQQRMIDFMQRTLGVPSEGTPKITTAGLPPPGRE